MLTTEHKWTRGRANDNIPTRCPIGSAWWPASVRIRSAIDADDHLVDRRDQLGLARQRWVVANNELVLDPIGSDRGHSDQLPRSRYHL